MAAEAIRGNSVDVAWYSSSVPRLAPADVATHAVNAKCVSPLVVVSAHLPITISILPLMLWSTSNVVETYCQYKYWCVVVASQVCVLVVSAVSALLVDIGSLTAFVVNSQEALYAGLSEGLPDEGR